MTAEVKGISSFEDEERTLFVNRVRFAAYYMAAPCVLSFSFVDYFFHRELWLTFLYARLLSIPCSLVCYHLYRLKAFREKYCLWPGMVVNVYLGVYTAWMIAQSGLEHSSYYSGLNLMAIGSFSFIPWTPINFAWAVVANYLPYIATVLWMKGAQVDLSAFIPALAFCLSTVFLGILTNIASRKLRHKEYEGRVQLQHEIETKNVVIEQKTKEGIYLEKLTNQFSPQVIEGVKSGRLSIEGMARREVTCLFIDIESSTDRSVRLDRDDYTGVLSEFFSAVTDILIKNDVTAGTYLGDGMLAFANAPQPQKDHRLLVLRAAMEILKLHHARRNYYLERWRSAFNIRMGINTGYVFVGFFPSFRRGAYTPLGAPVNLAARLCGKAEPNSILTTKLFIKETAGQLSAANVAGKGAISDMKGFEGEIFELFAITPVLDNSQEEQEKCPLCQAMLTVLNDLGESVFLKCPACGYTDLRPTNEAEKKAA